MEGQQLLNARAGHEADARLRRRREASHDAATRAAAREATEAEQTISLEAQINKWNNVGGLDGNSHQLTSLDVVPLGSFISVPNLSLDPPKTYSPHPRL
jgi:hypothetical protein